MASTRRQVRTVRKGPVTVKVTTTVRTWTATTKLRKLGR